MTAAHQVLFPGVMLLMVGCSLFVPKETLYLKTAQDQATQEEVRQRLGAPAMMTSTKAGESVWVYEVYDIEPGCQSTWCAGGSWCDEYVLTFDTEGILRRWTHKAKRHGGELMPTYCVSGGFNPPS
jgi:hypothetical protein